MAEREPDAMAAAAARAAAAKYVRPGQATLADIVDVALQAYLDALSGPDEAGRSEP
ncbi:MAG: hypothetical protein QM809_11410 [Gordonia sp. (in: high G+C Gram-positive bacteria)]|uniref:hypothetical protein n=1 Tax=Gordonia sp. (in: high G+C Gram-positive bacteria) TaxID=84139 RepID=UPI0039E27C22